MKKGTVLGFDVSTTAVACGVRSTAGEENFVSVSMEGKTEWNGQPAHDLCELPVMILACLHQLKEKGWTFGKNGALSFSVRQHDMVLLDSDNHLLASALSWQCVVAEKEVHELRATGVEDAVGRIEARFILPKLIWALRRQSSLLRHLDKVMTTGDYIALMLTGNNRLSTSDGLSNGLLLQANKALASDVFTQISGQLSPSGITILPRWFPEPIQSGEVVGEVVCKRIPHQPENVWEQIAGMLQGWTLVSSLGDNHASGVGCGLADDETIVISGGTSGTVFRSCLSRSLVRGNAACFEYYAKRLLLMMLADCASWYERFVLQTYGSPDAFAQLDEIIGEVEPSMIRYIPKKLRNECGALSASLVDVASVQFSLAVDILALVRKMREEVADAPSIKKFVFTGGLFRSPLMREIMLAGIRMQEPKARVFVSTKQGPLANKSAALGAMVNAMVGKLSITGERQSKVVQELCPQAELDLDIGEETQLFYEAMISRAFCDAD